MKTDSGYFHMDSTRATNEELIEAARELAFLRLQKNPHKLGRTDYKLYTDKKRLFDTYKVLLNARRSNTYISNAAETFFENFYLVEKTIFTIESDLRGFKNLTLSVCADGDMRGMARVYALAAKFFSFTGAKMSDKLYDFLSGFETISPLVGNEFAVLPIFLRIALIKLLSGEALNMLVEMAEEERSIYYFKQLSTGVLSEKRMRLIIDDAVKTLSDDGFLSLRSRLIEADEFQKKDVLVAEAARIKNIDVEELISNRRISCERRRDVVKNVVDSLRLLDTTDFTELVERLSIVERALRFDSIYVNMDRQSKAGYRMAVESIAQRAGVSEAVVAKRAYTLTQNRSSKQSHVGYYLIGDGVDELLSVLAPEKKIRKSNTSTRLFELISLSALTALPFVALGLTGSPFYALLALIPGLSLGFDITSFMFKKQFKPRIIPRMKVLDSVPNCARTMVTVPVLITDEKSLYNSIDEIETHYAGNPLKNCAFSLLCDFKDGRNEENPGERELIESAKNKIAALNEKYAESEPIFYIFLRKRELNRDDNLYMGKERKRGAVNALVKLMIEQDSSCFLTVFPKLCENFTYMVVLDADTVLAPPALNELIGAMLHPLNTPEEDKYGIVRSGHGVIAPRMETTASSASKSRFCEIMSADAGFCVYNSAVSDLYQDTFDEGLFTGKGIFKIESFYDALVYKIPDNTVLSHDILEGCMLRAGYMTDTVLYDSEPSSFIARQKRAHRWIRGDFQLIRFISKKFPELSGEKRSEFLSPLSRFKLFMGMFRNVVAPASFAALIASLFTGFEGYTAVALTALVLSELYSVLGSIFSALFKRNAYFLGTLDDCFLYVKRAAYTLLTLATVAYDALDAIVRSLYRVFISHKNMLEWTTSASNEGKSKGLLPLMRRQLPNIIFGLFFLVSPIFLKRSGLIASIYGGFLLLSPIITALMELPHPKKTISKDDREYLLKTARAIYMYFNDFCTESTHFLPPDNYQESPKKPTVKHTSPTNIGMALMASLAAFDMEIIDRAALMQRLEKTIASVENLEKLNGMLYNWYNIETMEKLRPAYISTVDSGNLAASLIVIKEALLSFADEPRASALAQRVEKLTVDMDFSMLFNDERGLFYIGFDAENGTFNNSCYDMLASEARLTYFVAIALKKMPQKSWLLLSRLLVREKLSFALVSWGGTCFEYMMPIIFTATVKNTLMDETVNSIVKVYERRASFNKVFGISESGFYAFDKYMYYQYKAFGAPKLALAKMRENELVIAPYASILMLMADPAGSIANMKRLSNIGAYSRYGFFEAVDFTKSRVKNDRGYELVESFMAHHLGMSICAIDNVLNNFIMKERFLGDKRMRANSLLLEEKAPKRGILLKSNDSAVRVDTDKERTPIIRARIVDKRMRRSETQLLSNGAYTVYMRDDGTGFSKCDNIFLTRFSADPYRTREGVSFYLKCGESVWNLCEYDNHTDEYSCCLEPHKVSHVKTRDKLKSSVDVSVSPEINGEVRRITIVNHSGASREIELMAYYELEFARESEYLSHPAFTKLTIDALVEENVLMFNRRKDDLYVYAALVGGTLPRYATDRLAALGRAGDPRLALLEPLMPGNDVSAPIEPCCIARMNAMVKEGEAAVFTFVTGFATDAASAMNDARELIKTSSQVFDTSYHSALSALSSKQLSAGKAELFERIAAFIIDKLEKKPTDLKQSTLDPKVLYKYSISLDHPILIVKISGVTQIRLLKTLLALKGYLFDKGIIFDLVIIGDYNNEYINELKARILEVTLANSRDGFTHVLDGYDVSRDEENLLYLLSLVVIDPNKSLDKQFMNERVTDNRLLGEATRRPSLSKSEPKLLFFNGFGGFDESTYEYVIPLRPGKATPLPWSNIISNESFGAIVTESGGGFTYKDNSRLKKITSFDNDPVDERRSEMLFIKENGSVFTIAPSKIARDDTVIVRHGFGYTSFSSGANMLDCVLTVFVDASAPVKYYHTSVKNPLNEDRSIEATFVLEWLLGERSRAIVTEYSDGVLYAKNAAMSGNEYGFVTLLDGKFEYSSSRESLVESVMADSLDSATGSGLGAFSVLKSNFFVKAGETVEFTFAMGMDTKDNIKSILDNLSDFNFKRAIADVKEAWEKRLGRLTIKTSNKAMELMVNRWLLYQVYSSRLFSRAGYYQCGGAIGFRDQLQDCLSLIYTNPTYVEAHILRSAARQFVEGDVLHWWHPASRGVRTRITDDRLFLPYVALKYARITGDYDIFDEEAPYLVAIDIPEGKRDYYGEFEVSDVKESVYLHCVRAISVTVDKLGSHGLPLIGGGDWNDGMDNSGRNGGESVFLAFLSINVLDEFIPLCLKRGDTEIAKKFQKIRDGLRKAVEDNAYDGGWYKRAFLENGELGSHMNSECTIDSITQSFAVFCGARHSDEAFASAYKLLVDKASSTVALLLPPFSKNRSDVGYIKNYIDGVRENGAQYTHAACWLAMSAAVLGRDEQARELCDMLNPINHARTESEALVYKGEPYAIAGDVYTNRRQKGRAGWTFYTGSASLYYTLCIEYILGVKITDNMLSIEPPETFDDFSMEYKYQSSVYSIEVTHGKRSTQLDGATVDGALIQLSGDEKRHSVRCVR